MNHQKKDYSFRLPENLIACEPANPRDSSKMMVLGRESQKITSSTFLELADFLEEGTLVVINNSRVIPARLPGKRSSGGNIEVLLTCETSPFTWEALIKNSARLKPGESLSLCGGKFEAEFLGKDQDGICRLRFEPKDDFMAELERHGWAPLPPYIEKARKDHPQRQEDLLNYQTLFAKDYGSIAAPTAGLHFTKEALDKLKAKSIEIKEVTLHVGIGTFEPIRTENILEHQMHEEDYWIPGETAQAIKEAKKQGHKILAVGTTTARTLESAFREGQVQSGPGSTRIFIYPPYQFKVVDKLLTNFHLPESTLLMLISAMAGREFILKAYKEAVKQEYRFYSYGDCMLIL